MDFTNNEALRQDAVRQRLILEAAKDYAIFTTDLERRVTSWNAGAEAMFGYSEGDILGQLADRLFVPEDREQGAPQQEADRAVNQGRAENERWHLRKDGARLYGSGVVTPLHDEAGTIVGLVKIMRDLTDQKEAELRLRESERRLRMAIEATELGTWEWHLITGEVYWNEQHFRLFGMEPRPNPISADDFFSHIHPKDRDRLSDLLQYCIANRSTYEAEFCAMLDDGTQRWMSGYGRVVEEQDGKPTRMSGVMLDINERRQAEDALRQADRRKDEFLALLAHELRNPLATLRNTLLILETASGKNEGLTLSAATTLMSREVNQLIRLIDDLLDVSRISLGKVTLTPKRLDLVALIEETIAAHRIGYAAINRHLSVSLPTGPLYVMGDAARLKQIISNLMNNAAKFTRDGGQVWVKLGQEEEALTLSVRDNGIGIPISELNHIFELFIQVDWFENGPQGGLGLGLTLVRDLVDMHGGRVEARSAGEGQGSEFIVHLPTPPAETGSAGVLQSPAPDQHARRRVLVVDDNQDAATTLAMLLELLGNEVYTRFSGQAGLEAADSLRPQVVILDISMPGLDGYQTCRLLREQLWGKALLLIALSGYGQDEDKRRSAEAGFDAHLVKPVDLSTLKTCWLRLPSLVPARTRNPFPQPTL